MSRDETECRWEQVSRRSRFVTGVNEFRVVLTVEDFERAVAFYRDALGLSQLEDWSSDTGRVILLDAGRATLELMDEAQASAVDKIEVGQRVSGAVRIALEVGDCEHAASSLVAAGVREVAPPVVTPWGDRNARIEAPDGMQLTLFTPSLRTD
jgi:catechol 2,3-dioxygenase-like lactoylglutathione lyase family enzyme